MSYQHQYLDGTLPPYPVGKVVCIGRNYAEHAKELNNPIPTEPLCFIKPSSSIVSSEEGFHIPQNKGAVHYEAEIAVLIGQPLSENSTAQQILKAITGFACALDLTLRDIQATLKEKGYPWERAKAFKGACVLTPFVTTNHYPDFTNIDIRLTINSEVRQKGNSQHMLIPITSLIAQAATLFSLQPGDVILTGTPKGVGPLTRGDQLIMELPPHSYFTTKVL